MSVVFARSRLRYYDIPYVLRVLFDRVSILYVLKTHRILQRLELTKEALILIRFHSKARDRPAMDDNPNHEDRKRQKVDATSLEGKVQQFWSDMMQEVCDSGTESLAEFKTAQLPLARIKKIMKSDEDVRMISSETPVLFAKACEFFIIEMTLRAWHMAQANSRKTLTKADVASAVATNEIWDFLADTVPQEEGAEGAGAQPQGVGMVPGAYAMQGLPGMPMYPMYMQPGGTAAGNGSREADEEEADEADEE